MSKSVCFTSRETQDPLPRGSARGVHPGLTDLILGRPLNGHYP